MNDQSACNFAIHEALTSEVTHYWQPVAAPRNLHDIFDLDTAYNRFMLQRKSP